MTQESPAKVKVAGIKQVALVVKDAKKTAEAYWNILGIGPWELREWGSSSVLYDRTYHGKPMWAKEILAHAYLGDLEVELCQPVEGDSLYRDWLEERGEGLHHLKFLCNDVDGVARILTEQGYPSLQSGHFGDPKTKAGGFNYFDIKPLHVIWEPVHKPKSLPIEPFARVPETTQESPAKVKVTGIKQVALVVKDAKKTAEAYWNILGIGPWELREWGSSSVLYDRTYHGKPAWAKEILAHAYLGDLEVELCQPVEGNSLYRDWLEGRGEGLHHLKFLCDDIDEVATVLTEQGYPSLQSGHFGDPKTKAGGFNYFDIKPLHVIWEPVHKPKSLPIELFARIP